MIKDFFKNNYGAIILSVIISLIMIGPQLYFIYSQGDSYKGLYMMKSDAEAHVLARMQEFQDGNGLGNPFIFEYKEDLPLTFFTLSEGLLALPGIIFGISTTELNLFYKFLLPFITSLLAYLLLLRLTSSRLWSLVGTAVVMMGDGLFSIPTTLSLLKGNLVFTQFALYARPFSPGLSSILFLIYLHILLTAIRRKEWRWFFILGALAATSYYVYFFLFTFIFALNSIFAGLFYFLKEKEISKKLGLVTLGSVILGLPVIINAVKINQHPFYENIALFVDITGSRVPVFSTTGLLVAGFFIWYFWSSRKDTKEYFLLGLILTAFAVINQHVITGIWLHEGHYHTYFNKPIFTMVLFWTANKLWARNRIITGFLIIPVLLSFYAAIFIQYSSYQHWNGIYAQKQDYAEVFRWLRENSQPESVVFANEDISEYVPIFTSNNVFMETHAVYYLMPPERMINSLFLYLKLSKLSPDKIKDENFFHVDGADLRAKMPENIGDYFLFSEDLLGAYPSNTLELYRKYWKEDITNNLKQYRLDYIVWDKDKNPSWALDKNPIFRQVLVYKNLLIFEVRF